MKAFLWKLYILCKQFIQANSLCIRANSPYLKLPRCLPRPETSNFQQSRHKTSGRAVYFGEMAQVRSIIAAVITVLLSVISVYSNLRALIWPTKILLRASSELLMAWVSALATPAVSFQSWFTYFTVNVQVVFLEYM